MDFSETNEACDLKVSRYRLLIDFMKVCEYLKAKFQCHPARCLLPVEIMQRCGLATGPATVELLPYLLPY